MEERIKLAHILDENGVSLWVVIMFHYKFNCDIL
jgi:hypothetical protein